MSYGSLGVGYFHSAKPKVAAQGKAVYIIAQAHPEIHVYFLLSEIYFI
jgi:hypothetical protein